MRRASCMNFGSTDTERTERILTFQSPGNVTSITEAAGAWQLLLFILNKTPIHSLHVHWSYDPCIYSVETPFFPSEKLFTNMRCSIRNAVETEPEQQMLRFGIRAVRIRILNLPRKWNNLYFLGIPGRIAEGLIFDTLRLLTIGFLLLCVWVTQQLLPLS